MNPSRTFLPIVALGLVCFALRPGPCPAGEPPPDPPPPLARRLANLVALPAFAHASWGITVADAASGATLFATNAHRLLKPASNAKLFTGALALHLLGPDHRFRTDLVPLGSVSSGGTLRGDLLVRGAGDFSFAARFQDGHLDRALDPLVQALARSGVRRVTGGIVADDAWLPAPHLGNGWTWDDLQYYYGAPAGALNADDNVIDLVLHPGASPDAPLRLEAQPPTRLLDFDLSGARTGPTNSTRRLEIRRPPGSRQVRVSGSLPVGGEPWKDSVSLPDPTLHFACRLSESLQRHGIPVRRAPRRSTPNDVPRHPAISVESPPLAELLARMMKPSQNLYAQLLLIHAGRAHPHPPPAPSSADPEGAGLRALRAFLAEARLPLDEVRLDDGSGLSRSSLVSAEAVVRLLRFMDTHPQREAFLNSLPVAGGEGTLRNRLRGTAAEGNLRAKTGSLRHVSTLSGFVTNAAGRRLVFSALLNAYDPSPGAPSGREALDQLVLALVDSREAAP